MKRFFRKALIWLARGFAVLAVLLIVFYLEEDWRGARDWAACQKELAAKGESLELRQLAPPGKPEDDLSKVPIFAELYQDNDAYTKTHSSNVNPRIRKIKVEVKTYSSGDTPKLAYYLKGTPLDFAAWQKYYRSIPESHLTGNPETPAQDILQTLSQFDPELNEIDSALGNPNAYWPPNYERPFDAYLGAIVQTISLAKVLQLRAIAELENHQSDLAAKDYAFSFRLNRPTAENCFIVNYLVIFGVRVTDDSILWEGLRRHAWSDVQLHEMESNLTSTNMLALAVKCFRTERTFGLQTMKILQTDSSIQQKAEKQEVGGDLILMLATAEIRPGGWWKEDKSTYCQVIQKGIEAIDLNQGTLSPVAFPYHDMSDSWGWNHANDATTWGKISTPMSSTALPVYQNMGSKIAKAETYRRLARLACRLEEFRIAHGQYPEKLEELPDLPAHLNQEVLSEEPLRYQRKGDGYQLYSVGWNQKDDGGSLATDEREGDWLWPSP